MTKKRKVKDEPIILHQNFLEELQQMVEKTEWPYKTNSLKLQQRDRALISFLILTGVRNSETQKITKSQIYTHKTHLSIMNVQTLKHGDTRNEIILPKTGGLAPFTKIFNEWLNQIPHEQAILFPSANPDGTLNWNKPLSRNRIYGIIKETTGMFPHWFRGVCETIYGKQIFKNDIYALQEFMGVKNLQNLAPYVSGQWQRYTKNILNAKIT
ncbi:MAG: site-specific integrase [Nitrososphaerota archaeon]|nr:site-specific integrase [Nitrososphaerota archaeon]